MNITKTIKDLCTPAYVYFILSSISVLVYVYYMTNNGINNDHTIGGLFINVLYYLFWTWLLNVICDSKFLKKKLGKSSGEVISWILVLFPILFMILFMVLFVMYARSLSPEDDINSTEEEKETNVHHGGIQLQGHAPQLSQFESGLMVN